MSESDKNYEKTVQLENEYSFSQGHQDRVSSLVQEAVRANDEYTARARAAALLPGRAKAFEELSYLISTYAGGGVVSGMYLFNKLSVLQVFVRTISLEENKAQYDKLVASAVGNDEEGLKLFKEAANAIYELVLPHLEQWLKDTEFEADLINGIKLDVMQKMIATGGVPKRRAKKGKR